MQLREAKAALRGGRIDEACRLLNQDKLREFWPAQQLSSHVADHLIERARDKVQAGNTSAGWRDLQTASHLGGKDAKLRAFRGELMVRGLAEIKDDLEADNAAQALSRLEKLRQRGVTTSQMRAFVQIGQIMLKATELCLLGKFNEADACLATAQSLAPGLEVLETRRERCRLSVEEVHQQSLILHRALSSQDWTAVLDSAEALLAIAPNHPPALSARRRAWEAVGVEGNLAGANRSQRQRRASQRPLTLEWDVGPDSTQTSIRSAKVDTVAEKSKENRFVMWIDAVGGYLVCLDEQIVLGQPTPDGAVDVPILGDLSRRHAVIHRDREVYLLEPIQTVKVRGREIDGPALLADGDIMELGDRVQLQFRLPHSLSSTARLDLVSRHKTHPTADGVLLMADSCILGPASHSHVVCRHWGQEAILYRQGEKLHFQTSGSFQIDGQPHQERGPLARRSQVEGDDFSLSLEPVEECV